MKRRTPRNGFTLIEVLVVIGIIAILTTIVLVAINPGRQFAQARNTQRSSNINAILNAVGQNSADNRGTLNCAGVIITTTATEIKKAGVNLRPCLVPTYISEIPVDPTTGSNTCTSATCSGAGEDYATGYLISQDSNGRYTVCAPASIEPSLPGSTQICITR